MAPHSSTLAWKSHGWRSLVGCSPRGRYKLDTTERLHFHFYTLEKEMATHSSVLAWRIPGMGEPGLRSMGSHRVGHGWSDLAAQQHDFMEFIHVVHLLPFCFVTLFFFSKILFDGDHFEKSSLNLLQHCLCGLCSRVFGHEAWGIIAPRPEIKLASPAFEGEVLATGPWGRSLTVFFFIT